MEKNDLTSKMVFEIPASLKTMYMIFPFVFPIIGGYMAYLVHWHIGMCIIFALGELVMIWAVMLICSHQYMLTDQHIRFRGRNLLLQSKDIEVPLKEIARVNMNLMFITLFDKEEHVLMKVAVNNFVTPRVYEELQKRIN